MRKGFLKFLFIITVSVLIDYFLIAISAIQLYSCSIYYSTDLSKRKMKSNKMNEELESIISSALMERFDNSKEIQQTESRNNSNYVEALTVWMVLYCFNINKIRLSEEDKSPISNYHLLWLCEKKQNDLNNRIYILSYKQMNENSISDLDYRLITFLNSNATMKFDSYLVSFLVLSSWITPIFVVRGALFFILWFIAAITNDKVIYIFDIYLGAFQNTSYGKDTGKNLLIKNKGNLDV